MVTGELIDMNQENRKKLYERFPKFFPKKFFDLSIGDGWFQLFYDLCEDIHAIVKDEEFIFLQVKEKFGYLRIYSVGSGKNAEIEYLIQQAENKSGEICEVCGDKGISRHNSWIKILCDKHKEDRNNGINIFHEERI
jgi:hypothetical protein